jgi:hypothetical protein
VSQTDKVKALEIFLKKKKTVISGAGSTLAQPLYSEWYFL